MDKNNNGQKLLMDKIHAQRVPSFGITFFRREIFRRGKQRFRCFLHRRVVVQRWRVVVPENQ